MLQSFDAAISSWHDMQPFMVKSLTRVVTSIARTLPWHVSHVTEGTAMCVLWPKTMFLNQGATRFHGIGSFRASYPASFWTSGALNRIFTWQRMHAAVDGSPAAKPGSGIA
jgi:hypothetical protein